MTNSSEFLSALRDAVGESALLISADDIAPFSVDWRGQYRGRPLAVVRPATTQQVAAIAALSHAAGVAMVPQGGNTGLVGGGVPDQSGTQLVVSLSRLNRVRAVDLANDTVTVEAGVKLQALQQLAHEHGRLFPVSLAAEGSCEIGGNIATNAGGVQVLAYGNMRDQVLGLEVVLADGRIWQGLRGLRKDNTGYDLKQLFIAAEGTLGFITAATLKLWPLPTHQTTALVAVDSIERAVTLLQQLKIALPGRLTAFELISRQCLDLVMRHIPASVEPFAERHAWQVLVEFSDSDAALPARAEAALSEAFAVGGIADAVIAQSAAQAAQLWALRENTPEAEKLAGRAVKHDIALPISALAPFVRETDALLAAAFPGINILNFGHVGDGNLHYNCMLGDTPAAREAFYARSATVNQLVYDQVAIHNGSISAEHGLGQLKREAIRGYKSGVELDIMRAVKQALDPLGLMNPGKML